MIHFMLYIALFLPWTTLFLLEKKSIKRYMPVTIFTCFLMTIIFQIAYHYNWWIIKQYIVPWGYMIDISFAYGVFAVGTFWIFYLTYQKFWVYLLTNLLMDAFFCFVVFRWLEKLGIAATKNITFWQYFFVIFALSFILYGYQRWQEQALISSDDTGGVKFRGQFHIREKAR